jgi:hypothetical protein
VLDIGFCGGVRTLEACSNSHSQRKEMSPKVHV